MVFGWLPVYLTSRLQRRREGGRGKEHEGRSRREGAGGKEQEGRSRRGRRRKRRKRRRREKKDTQ